jgi:hypothetical protein
METTIEQTAMLPMDIKFIPTWLSWVGAVTPCLNALGVECDPTDVAGMSGYAFVMSVHKGMCPSGPTAFDWGTLNHGIHLLGRSTLIFCSGESHCTEVGKTDLTRDHCKMAYEVAFREISEGRPAVIWGAYLPEFAVVNGAGDGKFHVKSISGCHGAPEPPIPYDELEAPGGPYVLAFPTPTGNRENRHVEQHALVHAVDLLYAKNARRLYRMGLEAYDSWIAALEAGPDKPPCEKFSGFGNSYNAQCYAEAKAFALEFLKRCSTRHEFLKKPLKKAIKAYSDVSKAMSEVARLFPFRDESAFQNEQNRTDAIQALKDGKSAEKSAAKALLKAIDIDWPKK